MGRLKWDQTGDKYFELGVKQGVLFVMDVTSTASNPYKSGVAWNGLREMEDSPDGADANDMWADDMKYGSIRGAENHKGSIGAYTYPDEFEECNGAKELVAGSGVYVRQQKRVPFAMAWISTIGNDIDPEVAHRLHIVYGCTCSPSNRTYETMNENPDAQELSWDYESTPVAVNVAGFKPTAKIELDSRSVNSAKLTTIEDKIFGKDPSTAGGDDGNDSTLLMPDEIYDILGGDSEEDEED